MNTKKLIIIAILACIYLTNRPFFVHGESMMPNYVTNDMLIVNRYSEIQRGDVIVFKYPNDLQVNYCKRVVGMPGEIVEIKNNSVLIFNIRSLVGFQINESSYLQATTGITKAKVLGYDYVMLGTDEYYVLGDNREHSGDSREWGSVKKELIIGKVWFKV